MKIRKIIVQSRVAEISGVTNRIIVAYNDSALATDNNLESIFTTLKMEANSLQTALNRNKAESELDEKDSGRDEQLRAIYYSLQGYVYNPNLNVSTAAKTILSIFNNYGIDIVNHGYNAESAEIDSFLEDMTGEEAADSILKLGGFQTLLEKLTGAQNQFKNSQFMWEEGKTDINFEESASFIKKRVVNIINSKVITYLKAMLIVDEPKYIRFVAKVSEIIDANNIIVKKREK